MSENTSIFEKNGETAFLLASAVLKDTKGKILFLKRSKKHTTFVEHWQLLEGNVEFGEHPEDALIREIKEETGLVAQSLSLKFVTSWLMTVHDKKYQIIRIVYEGKCKGEICLSDEHDSFCWANLGQAKKLQPKIGGLSEILEGLSE